MINFVTLFNSNYLSRGMVLYKSLAANCPAFHLYVVAFDDATFNYLKQHPEPHLTAISLVEFEDEKLNSIKNSRSATEYCWTCTPTTVLFAIQNFKLDHCIYIDADLCFYANPQTLMDEWEKSSILITEHRYTPQYDQSAESGIYCVQFVGFKNNEAGMRALNYWRDACITWCYARSEDGKFGDQKYLDDWTTRFEGVHVLKHLGGGVAPWNMQQYQFKARNGKILGTEILSGKQFESVFFHFHGVKIYKDNCASLTGESYEMNPDALNLFYKPYILKLLKSASSIHQNTANAFDANGANQNSPAQPINFLLLLRWYLYDLRQNVKNIFGTKTKSRLKHHHFIKLEWPS